MSRVCWTVSIMLLFTMLAMAFIPFTFADPGEDGVLYVYTDSSYTMEASWYDASHHSYAAYIGEQYWIRVINIDDPKGFSAGDTVWVKVCYTDNSGNPACTVLGQVTITYNPSWGNYFQIGPWTVPQDTKICTTSTVHFYVTGSNWVAGGQFFNIGHMHMIPETSFGVAGSLFAGVAALVMFAGRRRLR